MASWGGCSSKTCVCSPKKRFPRTRPPSDGGRRVSPRADSRVPGDQAGDDGDVHLRGVRGYVLRQRVRDVLLPGGLASSLAADPAGGPPRVLRQLVADPGHQHRDPALERCDVPLRARGPGARQPQAVVRASGHDDRLGVRVRGRAAVRVHQRVRPRADAYREHVRQRLLRDDRFPRRARARRPDPAHAGALPLGAGAVLFPESRGPGRRYPLLALRRRGVDLSVRNSLSGSDRLQMRAVAVALTTVALLAACGGGGGGQPAGSHQVTMTEFKYDPSTLSVPAGKVTFWLVNSGSVAHDLIIRDSNNNRVAASELISAGDPLAFTGDKLSSGPYTFFCDPPRHEPSGVKGKRTVTKPGNTTPLM